MPLINWTETFSVGVAVLDDDHKKLIGMINELYDGIEAGGDKEPLSKAFDCLVEYTKVHFSREEQMFARTGYASASAHKQEHDALTSQVVALQQKYKAEGTTAVSWEVMNFLKKWMVHHILGNDRKYGPHLNAHGVQ